MGFHLLLWPYLIQVYDNMSFMKGGNIMNTEQLVTISGLQGGKEHNFIYKAVVMLGRGGDDFSSFIFLAMVMNRLYP